ncbi:hypothetical protein [Microbacterium sp. ZOR0019]|uniref:hypothetical protein n=1 Tax=Microbacterium sp. ZOR0019 TaxID=1339233 RepID=UPI000647D6AC|nr:hypothetical protein [Microbacterium sp. ZOR0019]
MGLFAELEYFEQRDLHRFFAPSKELYDDDTLAYRREMTKLHPSLPNQAGRAYAHFERVVAEDAERRANPPVKTVRLKGSPRPQRVVTVRGVARPEPDAKRLAQLIVSLVREDEKSGGELLKTLKK